MLGKFPLFGQNYKRGKGCAKFLAEIGSNFILIAANTKVWKQKIYETQDLTKCLRLVFRSSPG